DATFAGVPPLIADVKETPTPNSHQFDQSASGSKSSRRSVTPARTELFTPEERDALREAVVSSLPPGTSAPTPRQIRAFLSKYQIARALCGYRSIQEPGTTANRLAHGLAKAVFANIMPALPSDSKAGRFTIEQIITD